MTGGTMLWRLSAKLQTFPTKKEVADGYVSKELYNEFKGNIQNDIAELKSDIKDARSEIINEIRQRASK